MSDTSIGLCEQKTIDTQLQALQLSRHMALLGWYLKQDNEESQKEQHDASVWCQHKPDGHSMSSFPSWNARQCSMPCPTMVPISHDKPHVLSRDYSLQLHSKTVIVPGAR